MLRLRALSSHDGGEVRVLQTGVGAEADGRQVWVPRLTAGRCGCRG
jgi:hypothetical protein